jgi:rhodanese-related sulfurtransferase
MIRKSLRNSMMLVLSVSLVIGGMVTGGCVGREVKTPTPETPTQIIKDITPQEAFTLIKGNKDNPNFVIVDVRTPEEFANEHIENAINIDFSCETFEDELNELDKNKTYLIYCRSGGRSGNALDIMAELNFSEVYNMLDGINGWKAAGLPTAK